MRSFASCLIVLALVGAGCGDNGAGPGVPDAGGDAGGDAGEIDAGGDAGGEASVEDYCRAVSESLCEGLAACGCRFDTRPYDAAGCVEARTAACVEGTMAQAADVAAGRARVDLVALERCVGALGQTAARCGAVTSPDECRDVLVATAEIGGTCELAGGGLAFCAAGSGVCRPDNHECMALPGDGDECLGGTLCGRDLSCVSGTCRARGGDGDACEPGSCAAPLVCGVDAMCAAAGAESAACVVDEQCAAGLRCGTNGTCEAATAEGDGCRGPGECGAARACVPAPESRTCVAADQQGEACETESCDDGLTCSAADQRCEALPGLDEPCLDNQCAEGLTCADGLGTCVALPGEGQTCAVGARFCADGLGCRETTNTCEVPPGAGETCLLNPPDYLCAPGFGCDFDAGSICVARGEAGATCTSDRGCVESTYCEVSTGTCTARLAAGAACEDGNECAIGDECAFVAGVAVCRHIPAADQACAFECVDDLVCKGPGGECAPAFCAVP